jgi:hypothetical protein
MDGPSSPITSAPAFTFADQTFNLADYPPGDNVVIGNKEKQNLRSQKTFLHQVASFPKKKKIVGKGIVCCP